MKSLPSSCHACALYWILKEVNEKNGMEMCCHSNRYHIHVTMEMEHVLDLMLAPHLFYLKYTPKMDSPSVSYSVSNLDSPYA